MKVLHSVCQQIWKTQQWPQDWKRSVFIPIPKKGNAKECSSESEVAQSPPTLCDPMDCRLPGSSSMGFSRQEYWSGLPFTSPGDLHDPGIEPGSPIFQADALTSEPPGKAQECSNYRTIALISQARVFLVAQMVKCLPAIWETQVQSLGWEDLLEKEMATESSTLTWKIPWMEKPGRLQSMGSQTVRHC